MRVNDVVLALPKKFLKTSGSYAHRRCLLNLNNTTTQFKEAILESAIPFTDADIGPDSFPLQVWHALQHNRFDAAAIQRIQNSQYSHNEVPSKIEGKQSVLRAVGHAIKLPKPRRVALFRCQG
jgi:hypothetical protein